MKETDLQNVFDSFFIKVPYVDFTGKETQIVQFMKSAISKCYRHTYDKLDYTYDSVLHEGYFNKPVTHSSIELIAMFMVKEYLSQKFSKLVLRKQYLGTQAFNKIPANKEEFEGTSTALDYWTNEIDRFLMEFPDYSEER